MSAIEFFEKLFRHWATYIKVYGVKYFCTVVYAQVALFRKKQVLLAKKVQLFNIWTFYMKIRLHIIFWTANATGFIDPNLESSYKVLPRKVKLKPPTTRLVFGGVYFFVYFLHVYFCSLVLKNIFLLNYHSFLIWRIRPYRQKIVLFPESTFKIKVVLVHFSRFYWHY